MFRAASRIVVSAACFFILSGSYPVQASDHGRTVTAAKHPTFKRQADLTKWLKKNMIPGWMRQQDVLPIFGRGYWHPWDGFDANNNSRFDNSIFIYDLDALGVHDHRRYDALFFHFDPTSGKLLNAGVEEMERQTGFHLTTETESSARE